MYYSDLLTSSENKSKTSCSIIKREIGKANGKNNTLSEFKLVNKITYYLLMKPLRYLKNYLLNLADELNIQQANI